MELTHCGLTQYANKDELGIMRQWILDNEKSIITENKHNPKDDGGTGLGQDSPYCTI